MLRDTTDCSAAPMWQAVSTGSMLCSGWAPCEPLPSTWMSKNAPPAIAGPGQIAYWPTSMPGRLCMPNTASQGNRSNSLSSSMARAPPIPSSPGWKMKWTVPLKSLVSAKVARGAEQHGGVAVMPAGMHHARRGAAIRQVVRLHDGQRVHVRPQADARLAVAGPQHADHAGLADAAMHLDPPGLQLRRHQLRRAMLLQPQLRMGMQVLPERREFVMVACGSGRWPTSATSPQQWAWPACYSTGGRGGITPVDPARPGSYPRRLARRRIGYGDGEDG